VAIAIAASLFAPIRDLTPREALDHLGEYATVCGTVDDARYARTARPQPTFLNFGGRYPDHLFTAVIFVAERAKFGSPEVTYLKKSVCVSGRVRLYRGKPEMIMTEPKQLQVQR
jgi:hypothetical protein